jgi:isoamylase
VSLKVLPGLSYPLGVTWDGAGTNVALFSEHATKVELSLFDDAGDREIERIALPEYSNHVWHGYVPELGPGARYGFRVHGEYAPEAGQRFNPHKLLLDPYARAVDRTIQWSDRVFGYRVGSGPDADLHPDERDSAPAVPRSVVVDPAFDWGADRQLHTPWHETVIYETHVKGMTATHPAIPPELRGTYLGLASPPIVEHLARLGITAVELMPVHQFVADRHLVDRGLTNYWGYNSIAFFAPDIRYARGGLTGELEPGEQVREFKSMVKALHRAGIEVILDVVYNHTAEGNELGPTLSFRGIDNAAYYRLAEDQRYYVDYTGTGNTLNAMQPRALQLIMDSLRYWVTEMHVDGFRFDLAAALARELHDVDRLGSFFDIISQDPVLSTVKLIAEPWDLGEGGYQVGNFPGLWSEWNGRYRDVVRDFWRGADRTLAEFATRLTGSSDLYAMERRRPRASINFVTAHDGFTLHDLVSYNRKHNEANGDGGRDGTDDNRSWNCGTEGATDDPDVLALRARQQRNFLATLFLSQGVPMLLGGDEIGRSQGGNNNAYCQDNRISYFDWELVDAELLEYTRRVIALFRHHPVFRRRHWFQGRPIRGGGVSDIGWFRPDGEEMSDTDWNEALAKTLGVYLNGRAISEIDRTGERTVDDSFFLLFNAAPDPVEFRLPDRDWGRRWRSVLDTRDAVPVEGPIDHRAGATVSAEGRSVIVLRRVDDEPRRDEGP